MLSRAAFMGRSRHETPGAHFSIYPKRARVYVVDPSAGSLNGTLPAATTFLHPGGPFLYLLNISATNAFTLKDSAGGTIATVGTEEAWIVSLLDNTTAAGSWQAFGRPLL
jgi:hypothetical protein